VKRLREELVFHFPHYQGDSPHSAIFVGDLKLMHFYEDGHDLLFDLSKDIGEQNDLSAQAPAQVAQLRKRLEDYLTAVNAQLPTPNAQFDPTKPEPPRQKGGGQNKGKNKGKGKGKEN
jgi:hypothetical protein